VINGIANTNTIQLAVHFLLRFLVTQIQTHKCVRVIINSNAGGMATLETREELKASIEAIFPEAETTFTTEGMDVRKLVREAIQRGSTLVIAGGGDGTVNAAASAVAGTDITLGILPLGTLNHFCKDLGIPMDLKAAFQNLVSGRVMAVDVGEVNGEIFVNNSGLGLYPTIVRLREKRQARGASKWIAAAVAALRALRHYQRLALQVTANGKELLRRASIVFLGNNEYTMEGLNIGTRTRLDAGMLCLYITKETSSLKLLGLTLSALMGKLQKNRNYDKILTTEVRIRSKHPTLNVSIDGEVIRLAPPLQYRIRPKALRVLVPGEER
jgi:YegS/Rv2252/BmrU family lipid kinase